MSQTLKTGLSLLCVCVCVFFKTALNLFFGFTVDVEQFVETFYDGGGGSYFSADIYRLDLNFPRFVTWSKTHVFS